MPSVTFQALLYVADLAEEARHNLHDCIPPVLLVEPQRASLYIDRTGPVVVVTTVERCFFVDQHGWMHMQHPDMPHAGLKYLRFQADLDALTLVEQGG